MKRLAGIFIVMAFGAFFFSGVSYSQPEPPGAGSPPRPGPIISPALVPPKRLERDQDLLRKHDVQTYEKKGAVKPSEKKIKQGNQLE